MSDLYGARAKVEKGTDWRGEITVAIDGDKQTLSVRQLNDTEFWDVMENVDIDEIKELQGDFEEDRLERFEELSEKDELTDEEETELENLQAEMEESNVNVFDVLSKSTFEGLKYAAKCAIVPDEEDVRKALVEDGEEIDDMYGSTDNEAARQYINDMVITPMIDESTDFSSFSIGVKAFMETLDTKGN
jgi:hypothetical protein